VPKDAEILILRHQVAVLQRLIISPRTLLRWHTDLVRRRWTFRAAHRGPLYVPLQYQPS
jgi:hypothetical protein